MKIDARLGLHCGAAQNELANRTPSAASPSMEGLRTVSTVYLRLYISNELARSENKLIEKLHQEFVSQPVADLRFDGIERRLTALERSDT